MQKLAVSRRRNFLPLMIFSAVAFSSLSFSTGGAYSFRRFPQKLQVTATDTLPERGREGTSINDEPVPDDGISKGIQDALRDVQRSLERLNAELNERNWFGNIQDQYARAADIYRRDAQRAAQLAQLQLQQKLNNDLLNKQLAIAQQFRMAELSRNMDLNRMAMAKERKRMELALRSGLDMRLQKAKAELQKAKGQLQRLRDFKSDLEAEGLIKKGRPYRIEIKEGKLYINGKKQKKSVYNKFKEKYPELFGERNFKLEDKGYGKDTNTELI
jgi:hypothetical protein